MSDGRSGNPKVAGSNPDPASTIPGLVKSMLLKFILVTFQPGDRRGIIRIGQGLVGSVSE